MKFLIVFAAFAFYGNCFSQELQLIPDSSTVSEAQASFTDGDAQFFKWVKENLVYPQEAQDYGIEGRCYFRFTLTTDGTISDISILRGVPDCPECDAEVKKCLRKMPKLIPYERDGNPIQTYWTSYVDFKLQ